ncbi:MAG TPA: hypothetical protein VLL27_10530 [Solirubrobacterales bacterium]|nr:hypothetical protein [Solirubrobacterales bacterium]
MERSKDLTLGFWHGCPGSGTHKAEVSLRDLGLPTALFVALTWAPYAATLSVGNLDQSGPKLHRAEGEPTARRLLVGDTGEIYEVGAEGVEVARFSFRRAGEIELEPSALETWLSSIEAIKLMSAATSAAGRLFEIAQANAIVSILVTSFEVFCQRRFREISGEGIAPDMTALAKAFSRIDSMPDDSWLIEQERDVLPFVSRRGINFQNYEQCKKAYSAAYGIGLASSADIDSKDLKALKDLVAHRHKVVHVSPTQTTIGPLERESPVFVSLEAAQDAIEVFERVIHGLHAATLSLRSPDSAEGKEPQILARG